MFNLPAVVALILSWYLIWSFDDGRSDYNGCCHLFHFHFLPLQRKCFFLFKWPPFSEIWNSAAGDGGWYLIWSFDDGRSDNNGSCPPLLPSCWFWRQRPDGLIHHTYPALKMIILPIFIFYPQTGAGEHKKGGGGQNIWVRVAMAWRSNIASCLNLQSSCKGEVFCHNMSSPSCFVFMYHTQSVNV